MAVSTVGIANVGDKKVWLMRVATVKNLTARSGTQPFAGTHYCRQSARTASSSIDVTAATVDEVAGKRHGFAAV